MSALQNSRKEKKKRKQNKKRKKVVAVWSSFQKNESSFFRCVMMFLKLLLPNHPVHLSYIANVVYYSHALHFTSLIYCCVFIAVVNVLILLYKMGEICATVVKIDVLSFSSDCKQIKVHFFCFKEKHIQYIELIYEKVFMCMFSVITFIPAVGIQRFVAGLKQL